MPLTLFLDGYFVNPWDAVVYVALEEKQLPYSTVRALLRDGGGVPQALASQTRIPRIPALQHDEFWLTESMAIVEYLEQVFPPPGYARLYPAEPRARGRARQIMAFMRSGLNSLRDEVQWWMCVYPHDVVTLSPKAARDAHELVDLVEQLDASGELAEWNLAHVDLAFMLSRLERSEVALPASARGVVDDNFARPAVRAYLDHPRPPNPPPRSLADG